VDPPGKPWSCRCRHFQQSADARDKQHESQRTSIEDSDRQDFDRNHYHEREHGAQQNAWDDNRPNCPGWKAVHRANTASVARPLVVRMGWRTVNRARARRRLGSALDSVAVKRSPRDAKSARASTLPALETPIDCIGKSKIGVSGVGKSLALLSIWPPAAAGYRRRSCLPRSPRGVRAAACAGLAGRQSAASTLSF
jgi:hypothetical protein